MRYLKFLIITLFILTGCGKNAAENEILIPTENPSEEETSYVDALISNMTLEDMVYQMMFVTPEALTGEKTHIKADEKMKDALTMYPVGGIVYFADNFVTYDQTVEMINNTQSFSEIPLFISVDEEGGRVSRLGKNKSMGVSLLPPMSKVQNEKEAFMLAEGLGKELKALGFNMNFAPVCDILINKKNTEIGNRSFGRDPIEVADKASAFVKGLKKSGIMSVLKHFPGHGSTVLNSHSGYSESTRSYEEIITEELVPFKKGIEAGADFVMVSHMTLVNATEEKVPASVSEEVITKLLREKLGFDKIIITDSFSMGAITKKYSCEEAAVKAIKAGADMILMPKDVKKAFSAIVEAVNSGEIEKEAIEKSVERILVAKKSVRLIP